MNNGLNRGYTYEQSALEDDDDASQLKGGGSLLSTMTPLLKTTSSPVRHLRAGSMSAGLAGTAGVGGWANQNHPGRDRAAGVMRRLSLSGALSGKVSLNLFHLCASFLASIDGHEILTKASFLCCSVSMFCSFTFPAFTVCLGTQFLIVVSASWACYFPHPGISISCPLLT
jgi:hypothetical protein